METSPKNIGDLFKDKLENFSIEGNPNEWIALDMKLDKMSFFKFHLSHFNIYYAALIGICFSLSSAVFVDHFILERDNKEVAKKSIATPKEKTPSVVIPLEKEETNKEKQITHTHIPQVIEPKKNTELNRSEESQHASKNDVKEDIIIQESIEDPLKQANVNPGKKVVYITQQDTLVVYDTLTVKKRKHK